MINEGRKGGGKCKWKQYFFRDCLRGCGLYVCVREPLRRPRERVGGEIYIGKAGTDIKGGADNDLKLSIQLFIRARSLAILF